MFEFEEEEEETTETDGIMCPKQSEARNITDTKSGIIIILIYNT